MDARRKRAELGSTPGCPACELEGIWGHGRKHSAVCRVRRAEWEQKQKESGRPESDDLLAVRKRIKAEMTHTESELNREAHVGNELHPEAYTEGELHPDMEMDGESRERDASMAGLADREEQRKVQRTEPEAPSEDQMVQAIYCEVTGYAVEDSAAREWDEDEMQKVHDSGTIGKKVSVTEAKQQGMRIIGTRFLRDSHKQKSRLVVQDVRHGPVNPEHWAPTPTSVALKVVLLLGGLLGLGTSVIDISSAFLYAALPPDKKVAVYLPREHGGEQGWCHELKKSLYGLQVAPSLWAEHFRKTLESLGFKRSCLDPGLFIHTTLRLYGIVHVDDCVLVGEREHRER
eukprot:4223876-Amphidinium_carterae.1